MYLYNLLPYILILRPGICLGTFVLVILSTYIASPKEFPWISALLAGAGIALAAGAGSVVNDMFDLEEDKVNNPRRMIPSNLLTQEDARRYYVALSTISLLLLWLVNLPVFLVGVWCWASLFFYSWKLREINGLLSNVVVALSVAPVLSFGTFVTGNVTATMVFLFAFGFAVTLAREILGDITDLKGDMVSGRLRTMPIVSGQRKSLTLALQILLWTATFIVALGPLHLPIFRHAMFGFLVSFILAVFLTSFTLRWAVREEKIRHVQNVLKFGALFGYPLAIGIDRFLS